MNLEWQLLAAHPTKPYDKIARLPYLYHDYTKMLRFFMRLFTMKEPALVLGRWGYYGEHRLTRQVYYD